MSSTLATLCGGWRSCRAQKSAPLRTRLVSDEWLAGLAQQSSATAPRNTGPDAVFVALAPGGAVAAASTVAAVPPPSRFLSSVFREGEATVGLVFCIEEFELAHMLTRELELAGYAVQPWAHHETPADGHVTDRAHREVLRGLPRALRRAAAVVLLLQRGAQARYSAALLECLARKRRGQPNIYALAGPHGYFPAGEEEREAEGDVAALVGSSLVFDFSDFNASSSGLVAGLRRSLALVAGGGGGGGGGGGSGGGGSGGGSGSSGSDGSGRSGGSGGCGGSGGGGSGGVTATATQVAPQQDRPSFKELVAQVLKQLEQEGARPGDRPAKLVEPLSAQAFRPAAATARRSATA